MQFRKLSHTLNVLKEDYVTARHLFYQGDNIRKLSYQGAITKYIVTNNDADFGIVLGVRKAGLRVAADAFDKIAILINEGFDLGWDDRHQININNIWFENRDPKKGITHPKLVGPLNKNKFLKALKSIREDWYAKSFPAPLKGARDLATHQQFQI